MRFCEPCGVPTDRECRTRGNCTVIPTNVRVFGFIFPGLFKRTPKSKSMSLGDNFRATNGFFRCHRSLMENTAVLIHNWMHCNSLLSEDNTDEKTRGKSTKYHQIGGGDSSKFQRVGQRNGVIRVPNAMPHRVRRPGNSTPPIITKENRFDNSHSNDGNFPDSSLGVPSSKWYALAKPKLHELCEILFIFTPLSFERSFSCSGVIIPSSSAVHIQWPCRDLNPGHLTREATVLPLLHQRTLDASEFSRLNRRTCSHLSDVIGVPDPSNDDPVTVLVVTID
ncbi:hypothetical protein CSKR_109512 [Clonorchis sinensis]|uniref:Uncharacterized protein n=1 Tax=Clonorchis sinensis TaxID=79923 RepID=A0A419PQU3_CLOSI|nr:hypothetical protein CSKR_109512 [Clonorchis sinensis]